MTKLISQKLNFVDKIIFFYYDDGPNNLVLSHMSSAEVLIVFLQYSLDTDGTLNEIFIKVNISHS